MSVMGKRTQRWTRPASVALAAMIALGATGCGSLFPSSDSSSETTLGVGSTSSSGAVSSDGDGGDGATDGTQSEASTDGTDADDGQAPTDGVIGWAASFGETSTLWRVTPEADELVGTVQLAGTPLVVTDLAAAPDGQLFAIDFQNLYTLDPEDASATLVGPLGVDGANALVAQADGSLAGATTAGEVLSVDAVTGQSTVIGNYAPGMSSSGDLAIGPDGALHATITQTSRQGDRLALIDLASGSVSIVMDDLPTTVYGLIPSGDLLYGLTNVSSDGSCAAGELVLIDVVAGTTTKVRCLAFSAGGSAVPPGGSIGVE